MKSLASVALGALLFVAFAVPAAADGVRTCGTFDHELRAELFGPGPIPEGGGGTGADCSFSSTNPSSEYDPDFLYTIPVVVHILAPTDPGNPNCNHNQGATGHISDALVQTQIDILNEDFKALMGTPGASGFDGQIEFFLATEDPNGDPTTGITRDCNTTWYNDSGAYYNTLAWDPFKYLNIYTNTASGALGYVPFLPADAGGAFVGQPSDRVVILWNAFGRDAPFGPPYDQGRTATHEVGHYLGLEHTFSGSCAPGGMPGCYSNGDLICDTNPESNQTFGCPGGQMSCGSFDPIENYMDYTDDLCMEMFTQEQSYRMRCSLTHYRHELVLQAVFADGFESGNTSAWSVVVP